MADQALIKRINRARVMNAIRCHSPVSRSEIARLTALDRKSITNLVSELVEEGLVIEVGKRRAAKGRPLTLLEFERDNHFVLGISLCETKATGRLLNLYGESQAFTECVFPFDGSLTQILSAVKTVYLQLREVAGERSVGVGLSVPGIIDLASGLIQRSVNISALENVNIRDAVSQFVVEPLFLEEGSRAKALAEKWFGLGRQAQTFVCVDLGIGIGAGIVQDRRLYSSGTSFVGEIGHVIIERDGRPCRCGHFGCLEAYVSERVLLADLKTVTETTANDLEQIGKIDERTEDLLRQAGRKLGFGLSYVINIICPPLLIINGPLMAFREIVMPEILRGMQEGALPGCMRKTCLAASELKAAAALGAGARVLSEWFEVEGHFYV